MSEIFKFDTNTYPTLAAVSPEGVINSPLDIVYRAAGKLKSPEDIANFGRELTLWTANLKSTEVENASLIVGSWISYTLGAMGDNEIEQLWQTSMPQTDVATGFMPDNLTIRVKYTDADDLASKLRAATGQVIEDRPIPIPSNWPTKK